MDLFDIVYYMAIGMLFIISQILLVEAGYAYGNYRAYRYINELLNKSMIAGVKDNEQQTEEDND